ncbi:hypothetical protein [Corynebacterium sp. LK2510]|uniref:hypothetical protein n=1 Tax=Corynebacterium sp. LK2510 TaxID=3110472 RepID=UPI0034CE7282
MSTAIPSSPDADAIAAAQLGHQDVNRTPLLRRIPDAVFTTAYGALLVGIVVAGVIGVSYESDAATPPPAVERPLRPLFIPETNQANVDASVRAYLIADAESAHTPSGVTLTGTLTPLAEADTTEVSGHIARLLEQNCVDNMTVRTQDNMPISFWGFCYRSMPPEAIKSYVDIALSSGAQNASFQFHPGREFDTQVWMTWVSDSEAQAQKITDSFDEMEFDGGVGRLMLVSYGPESATAVEKTLDKTTVKSGPTGEAFKRENQVPSPALEPPTARPSARTGVTTAE